MDNMHIHEHGCDKIVVLALIIYARRFGGLECQYRLFNVLNTNLNSSLYY